MVAVRHVPLSLCFCLFFFCIWMVHGGRGFQKWILDEGSIPDLGLSKKKLQTVWVRNSTMMGFALDLILWRLKGLGEYLEGSHDEDLIPDPNSINGLQCPRQIRLVRVLGVFILGLTNWTLHCISLWLWIWEKGLDWEIKDLMAFLVWRAFEVEK